MRLDREVPVRLPERLRARRQRRRLRMPRAEELHVLRSLGEGDELQRRLGMAGTPWDHEDVGLDRPEGRLVLEALRDGEEGRAVVEDLLALVGRHEHRKPRSLDRRREPAVEEVAVGRRVVDRGALERPQAVEAPASRERLEPVVRGDVPIRVEQGPPGPFVVQAAAPESTPAPAPPTGIAGQEAGSFDVPVGVELRRRGDELVELGDRPRRLVRIPAALPEDPAVVVEEDRARGARRRELGSPSEDERPDGLRVARLVDAEAPELVERLDRAALVEERQVPVPEAEDVRRIPRGDRELRLLVDAPHRQVVDEDAILALVEAIDDRLHRVGLVSGPLLPVVEPDAITGRSSTWTRSEHRVADRRGTDAAERDSARHFARRATNVLWGGVRHGRATW